VIDQINTQIIMKVTQSGRSNRMPANYFRRTVHVRQPFYSGRTRIRRTIWFWAFWSNFLAYNTPVNGSPVFYCLLLPQQLSIIIFKYTL